MKIAPHKAFPPQHLDYSGSLWWNKRGLVQSSLNKTKATTTIISDVAEKPPSSRILTVYDEQWTHPSHNYSRTTTCHYFPPRRKPCSRSPNRIRESVIILQTLCLPVADKETGVPINVLGSREMSLFWSKAYFKTYVCVSPGICLLS